VHPHERESNRPAGDDRAGNQLNRDPASYLSRQNISSAQVNATDKERLTYKFDGCGSACPWSSSCN